WDRPPRFEYFGLWWRIQQIQLSDVPDKISWKWTQSGKHTGTSAYRALFPGSTTAPNRQPIWKCWAPTNAKFFLWLVSLDRCWTAERRARHGLAHDPHCKLCSQEFETIDHLLVQCVFSKITWHEILSWCRLPVLLPGADTSFFPWWSASLTASPASLRKGLNSLIALTAWSIWKHRNAALFDGLRPSTDALVHTIKEETRLWSKAGAQGLALIIHVV
uniref:Reverse transcriptase zinc-binding domain-containing protein n=1 Tax=Aegilops tauschii subsp. strangulata TaxID=200361 RepID=A0A453S935_AEGTS